MKAENRLRRLIISLYPNADAEEIMEKINVIASTYNLKKSCPLKMNYSEEEVILITYADIIKKLLYSFLPCKNSSKIFPLLDV